MGKRSSTAPKIVLTYFEGRGRAEPARLILAVGKMEYEDVRVSQADWPNIKSGTPFGQLPILEYDGVTVAQSMAIYRLLAKKADLAGENDLEQCQAEMIVEAVYDLHIALWTAVAQTDKEKKEEELKKIWTDKIVPTLDASEKLLEKSGGKFFVGDKLSWADIYMMVFLDSLTDPTDPAFVNFFELGPDRLTSLESRPLLADLLKRVKAVPEIKEHYKKRPANDKEQF